MAYAVGVLAVVTAVAVLVVVLWLPVRRLRQGTRDSAAQRSADRLGPATGLRKAPPGVARPRPASPSRRSVYGVPYIDGGQISSYDGVLGTISLVGRNRMLKPTATSA